LFDKKKLLFLFLGLFRFGVDDVKSFDAIFDMDPPFNF